MSLDQELGQLFLAQLNGVDLTQNDIAMIQQQGAGGILLYADNFQTADQSRALIAAARAQARIPLLTTVDEEGGWVDRLEAIYGFRPSAQMIGATGDPSYARAQGVKAAHDMSALGLNFDLAPDVDVGLVPGQDLRSRVFGSDPQTVTTMAGAYLQGLQSSGKVAGTLKHFPGLGSVLDDAHLDLPTVHRTLAQLQSVELIPYQALIASGQVQAVMSTDVLVPALDHKLPAELSPAIIDGYLRGTLGFQGVVVTDALYMAGIAQTYPMPQAAVLAVEAGDDLLIGPSDPGSMGAMIDALRWAVQHGQISKQRIDQSVRRILLLKIYLGLMPMPTKEIPYPWHEAEPSSYDLRRLRS
jgi:beta-N-acetylhexosaminidase